MSILIPEFSKRMDELPILLNEIMNAPPKHLSERNQLPKTGAIYVIYEDETPLYTSRTKNLRQRMGNHTSGRAEQSAFAFKLTREKTGKMKATYKPEGSRKQLAKDPEFMKALQECTERVKKMSVRFASINDPITQHLFEVYVALALETPYNEFKTS